MEKSTYISIVGSWVYTEEKLNLHYSYTALRPFFSSTLGWGANGKKYKGFTEKYSIRMCNVFSHGIKKSLWTCIQNE